MHPEAKIHTLRLHWDGVPCTLQGHGKGGLHTVSGEQIHIKKQPFQDKQWSGTVRRQTLAGPGQRERIQCFLSTSLGSACPPAFSLLRIETHWSF